MQTHQPFYEPWHTVRADAGKFRRALFVGMRQNLSLQKSARGAAEKLALFES